MGDICMELTDLYHKRVGLVAEARKIKTLADEQGRGLNETEETQFRAIMGQVDDLNRAIGTEEVLQAAERVSDAPKAEPTRPTPAAALPEATRTERPTITFPKAEKFRSLGDQLQAVLRSAQPGATVDTRLVEQRAATGLNEAVPGEGGFLVQTDFSSELVRRSYERAALASRARRMSLSTNANKISIPVVHETSRADGSRLGGVRAYWSAEADSVTASKPEFREVELTLHKLMATCYLTDELMADAGALETFVRDAYAEEIAFKLDDSIWRGTGSGQPLGFITHPAIVSVAKETGQVAATLQSENIMKMWARAWGRGRGNAVWFYNQDIEPQLFQFGIQVGVGGSTLYMPPGGLSASPYGTLFGRPMVPVEQAATLGSQGDIVFADMNQYLLVDKGGVQSAVSVHVRFLNDETVFRFTYRVAGQPLWHSALTPFQGTATLSPFVTLDARA
jgi:HK97 family phage major capsid protein